MKTIRLTIFCLGLAAALFSCDRKENAMLRNKVDSLNSVLQSSQIVEGQLKEVDALIDSIDISRKILRTKVVEGTSYDTYASRLHDINQYVKDTQDKIAALEKTAKNVKGLSSSVRRLKSDLELRSQELAALQLEVSKMRSENQSMAMAITKKDSTLLAKEDIIKVREADIVKFEASMRDTNEKNRIAMADMYYNQAQTLEVVADRTNFAPRKKKQAMREAMELYKISLSLGKTEAQSRIDVLEKELS
ncbi:MAG TPA: hypothetical protein VFU05_00940 [Cyclobacteriaceae bacterium]|nr:hypothetical protein [Cyclobacteriaceae bacterium]